MKLSGLTYSKPACVMKPKLTLSPRARYGRPGPLAAIREVAVERMNRMEAKHDGFMGVPPQKWRSRDSIQFGCGNSCQGLSPLQFPITCYNSSTYIYR